ncbi:hypothetical protein [Bacillus sp. JCM 19034]|uniref:hypothetical protein n=1 Tax=Bacillus sp. JCM 19034 TaxID=1481928 RepID=UPI0007810C25|nr:hypothetical protein [Bacillus sp. JCM 19034]
MSEEEVLDLGYEAYLDVLGQEPDEPNVEEQGVALYLPDTLSISESSPFNMLIVDDQDEQVYLLNHEPSQPKTAKFHLNRDAELEQDALIFEVVEEDDFLSLLVVNEYDVEDEEDGSDNSLEQSGESQLFVLVVIGGAKLSTLTTYDDLVENIERMTGIIQSYQVVDTVESS